MTAVLLSVDALIISPFLYKDVCPAALDPTPHCQYSTNMPRNDKEAAMICIIVTIVMGLAISITLAITLSGPFTRHTSSQAVAVNMADNVAPLFNSSHAIVQAS